MIDLFSSVGPVVKLRMMTDKETGKPKGYGFIEYGDNLTALSAIRNLNGTEYRGRAIKVDYSDADAPGGNQTAQQRRAQILARDREAQLSNADNVKKSNYYVGGAAQQPVLQTRHNIDSIQKVIKSLSKQQLIDILVEMKKFIQSNPEGGKQMLLDNPVLAQALLQIQLLFGLVKTEDMVHIQPNVAHMAPPPQPAAAAPPANNIDALLAKLPPAEQKVLREVLKLSPEQIRMLPAHVQAQVQLITAQLQKR